MSGYLLFALWLRMVSKLFFYATFGKNFVARRSVPHPGLAGC